MKKIDKLTEKIKTTIRNRERDRNYYKEKNKKYGCSYENYFQIELLNARINELDLLLIFINRNYE